MSISQYLIERATSIVYHTTDATSMISILRNNKFNTSKSDKHPVDNQLNQGYPYYFSVARSPYNEFSFNFQGEHGYFSPVITMKLDGDKLSQRYKAVPVDYFAVANMDLPSEMEDRFLLKDSSIPNAKQYIKEIHALIGSDEPKQYNLLGNIANLSTGIPLYCYLEEDANSWFIQDKRKSKQWSEIIASK